MCDKHWEILERLHKGEVLLKDNSVGRYWWEGGECCGVDDLLRLSDLTMCGYTTCSAQMSVVVGVVLTPLAISRLQGKQYLESREDALMRFLDLIADASVVEYRQAAEKTLIYSVLGLLSENSKMALAKVCKLARVAVVEQGVQGVAWEDLRALVGTSEVTTADPLQMALLALDMICTPAAHASKANLADLIMLCYYAAREK